MALDELESSGQTSLPPTDPTFEQHAQRGSAGGMPIIEVALACTPQLGKDALQALTQRLATLIAEVPDAPKPPPTPPEPVIEEASLVPWWKFW